MNTSRFTLCKRTGHVPHVKSQTVVDAVREEMHSCLRVRDLLDEGNCLLPNKQAQDATLQTDFIHLLDYDKGSEGICGSRG